MTRRIAAQVAVLIAGYVVGLYAVDWHATAIDCLGDVKFGGRCGFSVFYPLFSTFLYLPVLGAIVVAVFAGDLPMPHRWVVLGGGLAALCVWSFVSWRAEWIKEWSLVGVYFPVLATVGLVAVAAHVHVALRGPRR